MCWLSCCCHFFRFGGDCFLSFCGRFPPGSLFFPCWCFACLGRVVDGVSGWLVFVAYELFVVWVYDWLVRVVRCFGLFCLCLFCCVYVLGVVFCLGSRVEAV